MAVISPKIRHQFFDLNGNLLSGGLLHTTENLTDTDKITWKEDAQTNVNANPIVMDSRGECDLHLIPGETYRLRLEDSLGNLIWQRDGVIGGSSGSEEVLTIADLRDTSPSGLGSVHLMGYHVAGDNRMRHFYFDPTHDTAANPDNNGTIIELNSDPALGAWLDLENIAWSVKDFGAKGDGVSANSSVTGTDDTTAFSNAIAYINTLGGGTLLIPKGLYPINKWDLRGVSNFNIIGTGKNSCGLFLNTAIGAASSGNVGKFIHWSDNVDDGGSPDTTKRVSRSTMKGFRIGGNNNTTTPTSYGVYAVLLTDSRMEDVQIDDFGVDFLLDFSWINTFINNSYTDFGDSNSIVASRIPGGAGVEVGATQNSVNDITFIGCRNSSNKSEDAAQVAYEPVGTACWIFKGNTVTLIACDAEGSTNDFVGVELVGGRVINLLNCGFEFGFPAIKLGSSTAAINAVLNVQGCNFHRPNNTVTGFAIEKYRELLYDGGSAVFNVGKTITGATSGATARVWSTGSEASGTLSLHNVVGTFQNDEVITDDGSSPLTPGAAVANGTVDASFFMDAVNISGCQFTGFGNPTYTIEIPSLNGQIGGNGTDDCTLLFNEISGFVGYIQHLQGFETGKKFIAGGDSLLKGDVSIRDNFLGYDVDLVTLGYDNQTTVYTVGKILTGGTSGAVGTIVFDTVAGVGDGTLYLVDVSGTFQNNETITDSNSTPGSALATGAQAAVTNEGLSFDHLNDATFSNEAAADRFAGDAKTTPTLAPNDKTMQSIISTNNTAGAGSGNLGPRIGFGGPGNNQVLATIGSIQTGGDADQVGLTGNVHSSSTSTDNMIEAFRFLHTGEILLYVIKSGATQGGAGAAANELWKTASHATLPDNVVLIGV